MVYPKLRELIKPGGTIIEIGAHIGTDTIKLYRLLKPDAYFAIEPDMRNFPRLVALRRRIDIKIVQKAIGSIDGPAPFFFSMGNAPGHRREHTDSSSLMAPKENIKKRKWMTFKGGQVDCQRLDTLCSTWKIGAIDLIWMDVQGAELLVIEGGQETLKETRYLYTECQEDMYHGQPGLDRILEALPGWKMIFKNGDNVLLRNKERRSV